VPLVAYPFLPMPWATGIAIGSAALVLFALGAYKAAVTDGAWWWSGLELALIGLASAMAGYGIGLLFRI
jgi:VIT1/CCC1 family predicted Fe2+/Mn2+ transporter